MPVSVPEPPGRGDEGINLEAYEHMTLDATVLETASELRYHCCAGNPIND